MGPGLGVWRVLGMITILINKLLKTKTQTTKRGRKSLEARNIVDDERIALLEKQLAEAQIIAEDADRRYDEVCLSPSFVCERE